MNPYELTKRFQQTSTPIDSSTIEALVTGAVNTAVRGATNGAWMSPHQPLLPQQPQVAGRRFDYPVGVNVQYTPRGTEGVSFPMLRALAENYDLLRILIETRKDQMVKVNWSIRPIDEKKKVDSRCDEITKFLRFPDREHNWQTWLRIITEEMLVTDAACIYPTLTRGGDLYSLDLMDGATLKMVVDDQGRRPQPPDVAYQQVLKGIPAVDYSSDDLIYAPRNVRVNKLYGYSPVEQIIMTVNIALRRQLSQLQAYTEGNVPEALATVPALWNVDQIKDWQEYWDELLSGDTGARRHMRFIPDGMKYYATKSELLLDPFDEWLARVCCFCFSLPPTPFIKQNNRATGESAKEQATEEGLFPLLSWVKDLLDVVIWRYFGYEDLCFNWNMEEDVDAATQATIDVEYVRNGIKNIDDIGARLGLEPTGFPNAIYTATGAVTLKDVLNPPQPVAMPAGKGAPSPSDNPTGGTNKGTLNEPAQLAEA